MSQKAMSAIIIIERTCSDGVFLSVFLFYAPAQSIGLQWLSNGGTAEVVSGISMLVWLSRGMGANWNACIYKNMVGRIITSFK